MDYWPFWLSGSALAFVMVFHWLSTRRMMAVSGRFTGLVNRLREGEGEGGSTAPKMTTEELMAAIASVTAEQFGEGAAASAEPTQKATHVISGEPLLAEPLLAEPLLAEPLLAEPVRPSHHLIFLGALVAGGALSALLAGGIHWVPTLSSDEFATHFGGESAGAYLTLLGGGALVGFGTRMAGGCTSGHGLCGVSRFQKGSLVATAAFFGAGIAAAFLIEGL